MLESLMPDLKEIDAARSALYAARATTATAAYDYAKTALDAAHEALEVAAASGPLVSTYRPLQMYEEFSAKSVQALRASIEVNQLLLKYEETTDLYVDDANAEYKGVTANIPVVNALLEGAQNRANMAKHAIPANPGPGKRCDGSVFTHSKPQRPPDDA